MFIPFLGAVDRGEVAAARTRAPRRASAWPARCSARSAPASPIAIWQATGNELFQALAFIGFFLNLFNLLPVLPLDGGRAMAALTPWMWIVGYALLVAATVAVPEPDHVPDPAASAGSRPTAAGRSARTPRSSASSR